MKLLRIMNPKSKLCIKMQFLVKHGFEDAHFREDEINLLAAFLQTNPNVNDLNLSGNAYNKNFKCLIQDTKLKYLTLKFCGINHEDLKEFVEPMENSYKQPLVYLNLSNNNIGDEGARILAVVLRVNRILISLNVSANQISDEGASEILRSLQMFYLNQDEISIRRKIFYQYYMKKYEEIASNSPTTLYDGKVIAARSSSSSVTRQKNKSKPTKSKNRKFSKSAASLSEQSNTYTTTPREIYSAPAPTPSIILPFADISELISNLDFHSAYHPFVKETTLNGFHFLCRGNFVLTHLNLSFNHLSTETLRCIQEVLKYQLSNGLSEEGLRSVVMCGNDMKSEDTDHLQGDITEMFTRKTSRSGSSATLSSKETTKKSRKMSK
ncbi:uncharacterized protein LOC123307849 isoform X2 [Coccinella septempunctata]|uniref:uncharacterized protein LOC123307849 isoform X2 n=1 Tax=Coccinella septempunctata TaxID=41139 RepID=UPI001D08DA85|nr:uncharacterized protein LOC123307849 isoform X2 [Coccinella septempunctata]